MGYAWTHEEFMQRFNKINNTKVEILGTYVNSTTNILVRCTNPKCKHEYSANPRVLLDGSGCKKCAFHSKPPVKKKKSHTQFVGEVLELHPNIEVLGKYNGADKKILVRCKTDSHEWSPFAGSLINGKIHGCPKCAARKNAEKALLSHDEFINRFNDCNNKFVEILGTYKGIDEDIQCKCLICGEPFISSPYRILGGAKHYDCAQKIVQEKRRKTHEEFINEIADTSPNIKILGQYITANTRIKVKCLECGHEWKPIADYLSAGRGCPKCKLSKGEKRVGKFLDKQNITHEPQKKYDDLLGLGGGLLSYDFYLPTYNLLIEYQGEYHDGTAKIQSDEEFAYQQEHDRRKREYASKHNIKLLEIWYWDFDNIETILKKELNM